MYLIYIYDEIHQLYNELKNQIFFIIRMEKNIKEEAKVLLYIAIVYLNLSMRRILYLVHIVKN